MNPQLPPHFCCLLAGITLYLSVLQVALCWLFFPTEYSNYCSTNTFNQPSGVSSVFLSSSQLGVSIQDILSLCKDRSRSWWVDQDITLETGELHKSSGRLALGNNTLMTSNIFLLQVSGYPQERMGCPLTGLCNSPFLMRHRRHGDGGKREKTALHWGLSLGSLASRPQDESSFDWVAWSSFAWRRTCGTGRSCGGKLPYFDSRKSFQIEREACWRNLP